MKKKRRRVHSKDGLGRKSHLVPKMVGVNNGIMRKSWGREWDLDQEGGSLGKGKYETPNRKKIRRAVSAVFINNVGKRGGNTPAEEGEKLLSKVKI